MINRIKNLFSFMIAAIVMITATSGKLPGKGYTITGHINGIGNRKFVFAYKKTATTEQVDSVTAFNGNFTIKGTLAEPTRCFINLRDMGVFSFYVENADISVEADVKELSKAVVKGSATQDDYIRYFKVVKKSVYDQYEALYKRKYEAENRGEVNLDPQSQMKYTKEFADLETTDDGLTEEYIKAHPNSYALPEIIYKRYIVMKYNEKAKKFYDMLAPGPQASFYGKQAKVQLDLIYSIAIGKVAPDFHMKDTQGNDVKLSDFRGKYVLLDFWASWCGPCRAENPNVVKNYQKYKDKNFTVLGVSLDRANGKEAWLKAIQTDHLDWTQVSDLQYFDNAAAKLYGVLGIPQNFLIGPDGKLVAEGLRGDELTNKLASLVK